MAMSNAIGDRICYKDSFDAISEEDYQRLLDLCRNNARHFEGDVTEGGVKLHAALVALDGHVSKLWPQMIGIQAKQHCYDFDETTPGNGYRSFVTIALAAIRLATDINSSLVQRRNSAFFRKAYYVKELESCAQLIAQFHIVFLHLNEFMVWSRSDELFPREFQPRELVLSMISMIDLRCFYGRHLCFHFSGTLKHILHFIATTMAIFSESYFNSGSILSKATGSVMALSKYWTDPERRAERIVNLSCNADVNFCKTFWFLSESELMCTMPPVVAPTVAISKLINIPPEPLTINGIEVPVPNAHIGRCQIPVRLISRHFHEGMLAGAGENKSSYTKEKILPPARCLLVHCHGGGFVAQSSLSHESYLREWAARLQMPILSVDYTLAPEGPFPRAIEELVYTYCWALNNRQLLGTTAERVVFAGDSAGANLLLATTIRCKELALPMPDGLFFAYMPVWIELVPSPSRTMFLLDPLLPVGFLLQCMKAYASPSEEAVNADATGSTESFSDLSDDLQARQSQLNNNNSSEATSSGSLLLSPDDNDAAEEDEDVYVSDFLQKYVLDTQQDGQAVLREETVVLSRRHKDTAIATQPIHRRLTNFMRSLKWRLSNALSIKQTRKPHYTTTQTLEEIDRPANYQSEEFLYPIPNDPLLHPIRASDDQISGFPPIRLLTSHLDPCLDDCIMMAKKLRRAGNDVQLDVLYGLPHGFLNFSLFSKEAHEGSLVCVERIRELCRFESDADEYSAKTE